MIVIAGRKMLRPQPIIGFVIGERREARDSCTNENEAKNAGHKRSGAAGLGFENHFTRHTRSEDME